MLSRFTGSLVHNVQSNNSSLFLKDPFLCFVLKRRERTVRAVDEAPKAKSWKVLMLNIAPRSFMRRGTVKSLTRSPLRNSLELLVIGFVCKARQRHYYDTRVASRRTAGCCAVRFSRNEVPSIKAVALCTSAAMEFSREYLTRNFRAIFPNFRVMP